MWKKKEMWLACGWVTVVHSFWCFWGSRKWSGCLHFCCKMNNFLGHFCIIFTNNAMMIYSFAEVFHPQLNLHYRRFLAIHWQSQEQLWNKYYVFGFFQRQLGNSEEEGKLKRRTQFTAYYENVSFLEKFYFSMESDMFSCNIPTSSTPERATASHAAKCSFSIDSTDACNIRPEASNEPIKWKTNRLLVRPLWMQRHSSLKRHFPPLFCVFLRWNCPPYFH